MGATRASRGHNRVCCKAKAGDRDRDRDKGRGRCRGRVRGRGRFKKCVVAKGKEGEKWGRTTARLSDLI